MKTIFLGDIHGDWSVLNKVLQKYKKTDIVQIGDFGVGFTYGYKLNRRTGLWEKTENNDPKALPDNFKFIRGNHDNPETCRQYPNYLGDYGYDEERKMFFVSGAFSIDREYRKAGENWWEDEELSIVDFNAAIQLYDQVRPTIMVSHTCPQSISNQLMNSTHKRYYQQRTEIALDRMFEIHKPEYWIFGHWHIQWRKNILGTNFVCVPINGKLELNL